MIVFALNRDAGRTCLQMEIVDDGVGLPPERKPGVGLRSMRERAEELGGALTVDSIPHGGTRVVAILPLENNGKSRLFDQIPTTVSN